MTAVNRLKDYISHLLFVAMFLADTAGKENGITRITKLKLVSRIRRNNKQIKSLTTWIQHLMLVNEIIKIPDSLSGDVVECGCYNGASTISLSLACSLANRRLIVCDSFEGLPKPRDNEKYDIHADSSDYYMWEEGEYSSEDGLNTVKNNVRKYGNISVCQFVEGYFADTLEGLDTESIVLVFEDVDIRSSVEDCIRYLWPKLQEDCCFFCHEPWSIQVVSLFYDSQWWRDNLNSNPPGFFGSGYGLAAGLTYSKLGFAKKFDAEKIKETGSRIIHEGSRGI